MRYRILSDEGRVGSLRRPTLERLFDAVAGLATDAVDRVLVTGERVTSAAEGRRLLAHEADTEALADNIQRVVVIAVPVVRTLARGARFTRVPWVMVASTAVSLGIAVKTGVRELQVLAALVAFRFEQTTETPADRTLVRRIAVDLYLEPKRPPGTGADRPRVIRLTRRWIFSGTFGHNTSKQVGKALDAAERLDYAPPVVGRNTLDAR